MSLRYPKELNSNAVDYVVFRSEEYRTNRQTAGGNGPAAGAPTQGASIALYMPTSTPSLNQSNDWGAKSFDGPLGALIGDLASGAVSSIQGADLSSQESAKQSGEAFLESVKTTIGNQSGAPLAAGRQLGVNVVAGMAGMQPNQLMALSRGEIFNPNVELLYQGPKVRGFNFNYTFVPKSQAEAEEVNRIVMEFKKWSAPENTGNGMFKVPHVWQVTYMTGGQQNQNMNAFKKAALTNVAVQANPGMSMHMSFDNGMPVVTALSLSFTEVDIITRNDHESAGNAVGY